MGESDTVARTWESRPVLNESEISTVTSGPGRLGVTLQVADSAAGLRVIGPAPAPDGGRRLLRRLVVATVLTDALAIVAALLVARHIRFGPGSSARPAGELLLVAVAPLLWVSIFAAFRLYAASTMTPEDEFRQLLSASVVGMAALVMVAYWSKAEFSRIWLGLAGVFACGAEVAIRAGWRSLHARLRASGRVALRTLIVGTNVEARELARTLGDSSQGYVPIGFVGMPGTAVPKTLELPTVGSVFTLGQVVKENRAACIFVAASSMGAEALSDVARIARQEGLELMITSRLPEVLSTRLAVRRVGSTTAMSVMPPRLTRSQAILKRAFDVAVSSTLMLVSLPLIAAIVIAVRVDSPGPVLFRQRRVTKNGRAFTMLKFRSMVDGAPARMPPGNRAAPFFKIPDDRDVTRVGRFLRRWSLDELPQFVNVLRGDMSLVGPRPLPVEQVEARPELLEARHEVKSGMTGWWQVRGRSRTPAEEAIRLDLFYIENWSLAYDLYILAVTIAAVLRGRGAR